MVLVVMAAGEDVGEHEGGVRGMPSIMVNRGGKVGDTVVAVTGTGGSRSYAVDGDSIVVDG